MTLWPILSPSRDDGHACPDWCRLTSKRCRGPRPQGEAADPETNARHEAEALARRAARREALEARQLEREAAAEARKAKHALEREETRRLLRQSIPRTWFATSKQDLAKPLTSPMHVLDRSRSVAFCACFSIPNTMALAMRSPLSTNSSMMGWTRPEIQSPVTPALHERIQNRLLVRSRRDSANG